MTARGDLPRPEAVELVLVELALVTSLAHAGGVHARRPVVLARVLASEAEGVGECSALEAPTYTSEYAEGAFAVLRAHLAPLLLRACAAPAGRPGEGALARSAGEGDDVAGILEAVGTVTRALEVVRGHRMAKAALEEALLDLWLGCAGRSLATALGAVRRRVVAGATVGLAHSPQQAAEAARAAVASGYRRLKLKVAPGRDVAFAAALRAACPGVDLVVDANGSYDLALGEHRRALSELDELGLAYLEQPLAPGALLETARLARALATPVVLDEAIGGEDDARVALALQAADGVVVKPGPLGGVLPARRVAERWRQEGRSVAVGGLLESGVGRAAALALAALPAVDLGTDLGASDRYFAEDLTDPFLLDADGRLSVPGGPGLGVSLRADALSGARRALVRG